VFATTQLTQAKSGVFVIGSGLHAKVKFSENAVILYHIVMCTAVGAHVCVNKIDTV